MGMYTALHFNADLKLDVPAEVLATLRYMVSGEEKPASLPNHPLFGDTPWSWMLQGDSFYFRAQTRSEVVKYPVLGHGLSITCNFKNYSDELAKFLDWIMPYVGEEPGHWLGYHMYEEDKQPTLIFCPDGE